MKLSVHIGLHKTGTTSLQRTLEKNRDTLARSGILYPVAGTIQAGGHLNLVWELTSPWKYNPSGGGFAEVVQEIRVNQPQHAILSAESFSGYRRRDDVLAIVGDLAAELGAELQILATIRPQFLLLDSLYAQNASTGYTEQPHSEWLITQIAEKNVDLESLLGRWFDAYDNVTLIPVEKGADEPLVQRFMHACGISQVDSLAQAGRANMRTGRMAVEYGRVATHLLSQTGLDQGQRHAVIREVRRAVERNFPDDPAFAGMTREIARFIHTYYQRGNSEFFKCRNVGLTGFQSAPRDYEFTPSKYSLEACSTAEREQFERILLESIISVVTD